MSHPEGETPPPRGLSHKILSRVAARERVAEARRQGHKIVFTYGDFDILHAGHLAKLEGARRLGDLLVVGLHSDVSVRGLKGDSRPIIGQEDRALLLAGLACVDVVVIFDESTPEELIRELEPDVSAGGGDHAPDEIVGTDFVRSHGDGVVTGPPVAATGEPRLSSPVPTNPGRRTFFQWLTYAAGVAASVVLAIPIVGYLVGALRKHRIYWVELGSPGGFPVNETRLATFRNPLGQPWDGMAAQMGVYVRNLGRDEKQQDRFLVFAMNCAHLGCPVTWFPQSGLFMCPCHGGVYYEDGERASGPPPRGLFHCVWRVRDGQLEVQAPHLPTLQHTLDKPSNA